MLSLRVIERLHATTMTVGKSHNIFYFQDITTYGTYMNGRAGADVFSEELDLSCSIRLGKHRSIGKSCLHWTIDRCKADISSKLVPERRKQPRTLITINIIIIKSIDHD